MPAKETTREGILPRLKTSLTLKTRDRTQCHVYKLVVSSQRTLQPPDLQFLGAVDENNMLAQ